MTKTIVAAVLSAVALSTSAAEISGSIGATNQGGLTARAGIGVALFSGTTAGDRELGSAFNFEDRIGAGLKFSGGQRIGVRALHYSNAGIKQPNDGIESFALFYSQQI